MKNLSNLLVLVCSVLAVATVSSTERARDLVMISTRDWTAGEDISYLPTQTAQDKACNAAIEAGESNPDIIGACPLK